MEVLERIAVLFTYLMAGPPFPVFFFWIAVGGIPVILLHEVGHAVVARRLLGGRVDVTVGNAVRLAELRVGDLRFTLNAFDDPTRVVSGSAEFDASNATARDVLLIVLAGPLASFVGVVVSGWAFVHASFPSAWHDFLWATTLGGVFAVLNIVPLTIEERRGGPAFRTDGRIALDMIRLARAARA